MTSNVGRNLLGDKKILRNRYEEKEDMKGLSNKIILPLWKHKLVSMLFLIVLALGALFIFRTPILASLGNYLVRNDTFTHADASVVLNSYPLPRLIEASRLYNSNKVDKIVINGNRKSEARRWLDERGYKDPIPWHNKQIAILKLLGVPEEDIILISAEDAYDTVTEAYYVGKELAKMGMKTIAVTTSKFHTRRAGYIWDKMHSNQFKIYVVGAQEGFFDPDKWWKDGKQARVLLSEYGAFLFYFWKKVLNRE